MICNSESSPYTLNLLTYMFDLHFLLTTCFGFHEKTEQIKTAFSLLSFEPVFPLSHSSIFQIQNHYL